MDPKWILLFIQTPLDAAGLCCDGGHIDECGVCNGYGASCGVEIMFQRTSSSADRQCVLGLLDDALQLRQVIFESALMLRKAKCYLQA